MTNDDLGNLKERIEKAKTDSTLIEKPGNPKINSSGALQAGLEIAAGTLVGGGIGYFIDKKLESMPLFFIVCLLLGSAGGIYTVVKQALRETQSDKPDDKP